jgi:hypothetical protein
MVREILRLATSSGPFPDGSRDPPTASKRT